MKTSVNMVRRMGTFNVIQRTSDGMFNATSLLKQWNDYSGQQKKLDHYFDNSSTNEFIDAIMVEENLHTRNSVYVKSRASRGDNAGTWMHPLLFIDYAMWLNATFKVKVLKFVYDEMIRFRIEAGDAYREMTCAISKIVSREFLQVAIPRVAQAINHVVYGRHEKELRNKEGDEKSVRDLLEIERDIAKWIDLGFIQSYDDLISKLRVLWRKKWEPKALRA